MNCWLRLCWPCQKSCSARWKLRVGTASGPGQMTHQVWVYRTPPQNLVYRTPPQYLVYRTPPPNLVYRTVRVRVLHGPSLVQTMEVCAGKIN